MLYKIREGHNVFEDNPELLAIPEFARLDSSGNANLESEDGADRRMRFVILVADRKSPLRTLPEKVRREKCAHIVGYKMEGKRLDRLGRRAVNGEVESIELAIAKYKELQWDENQDTLDTVNAQINEIKDYLKSDKKKAKEYDKALERASKLGERLPALVEAKQKLETLLQITIENKPEITTYTSADVSDEYLQEGSEELPTIELFMRQRENK